MVGCRSPRRRFGAISLTLALAVVGAACGDGGRDTGVARSQAPVTTDANGLAGERPVNAGPVSDLRALDFATDPAGKEFAFTAARPDGLLVVYFGYLSCPDICPLTMSDTALGVKALSPAERARVEVAMVTIDPERDLGDNLRNYLTHFFPAGVGLGGIHGLRATDDASLRHLAYTFNVTYRIDPHAPGQYYGVAHTGDTYVVNGKGELIWKWPYGTNGQQVGSSLTYLLRQAAA
jgi:protein SCO1/2